MEEVMDNQEYAIESGQSECSKLSCTGNCPCHVYFMAVQCFDGCPAPAEAQIEEEIQAVKEAVQEMQTARPKAIYGCKDINCATETSFPADMLYWWDGYEYGYDDDGNDQRVRGLERPFTAGWYCEECIHGWNGGPGKGISLETFSVSGDERGCPVAGPLKRAFADWIDLRTAKGVETYGHPLTTHNGHDAALDQMEELLDFCQYQQQRLMELEDEVRRLMDR